jgi:hypothetical protein
MEEMRNSYKNLVEEPEGKRQLGIPRCRWKNNIQIILKDIRFQVVVRINVAQNRGQCKWRLL